MFSITKPHKSLKIHEKYLKLKQTQKMYNTLREWYTTEPLNMACLDPSGQLFPVLILKFTQTCLKHEPHVDF